MSGHVNLNITPGDDPEHPESGASCTIEVDGVSEQGAVQLVLLYIENFIGNGIRQQLEEAMPMGNVEILDALTLQNARLSLLHEVMHLPAIDSKSVQFDM